MQKFILNDLFGKGRYRFLSVIKYLFYRQYLLIVHCNRAKFKLVYLIELQNISHILWIFFDHEFFHLLEEKPYHPVKRFFHRALLYCKIVFQYGITLRSTLNCIFLLIIGSTSYFLHICYVTIMDGTELESILTSCNECTAAKKVWAL